MDNVVTINHTKENILEFDLTMEGVENKDITVMLMVDAKDMSLGFKATKKEKDKWAVKLPKLPMLEKTAYKFHIMVHADGYHFEPFKGTLNVVGSAEIYSSEPKNVTIKPADDNPAKDKKAEAKAPTEKKEQKKEQKVAEDVRGRSREKSIEQIARELTEKTQINSQQKPEKKVENQPIKEAEKKPERKITLGLTSGTKTLQENAKAEHTEEVKEPATPKSANDERQQQQRAAVERITRELAEEKQRKQDEKTKLLEEQKTQDKKIQKSAASDGEKPIEQIARELMEKHKFSPEAISKKVEEVREAAKEAGTKTGSTKDDKVLAILEEVGITPKRKKRARFSIVSH
jgi:hypothetical protein